MHRNFGLIRFNPFLFAILIFRKSIRVKGVWVFVHFPSFRVIYFNPAIVFAHKSKFLSVKHKQIYEFILNQQSICNTKILRIKILILQVSLLLCF